MRITEKNKTVYILLTKTSTLISRIIGVVTKTQYTHAALSLDYELTRLYSFGRLYTYNPFIGCFKHEETNSGVYGRFRRSPCVLIELKVNETSYDAICERIYEMSNHKKPYKYNIIGLFGNYFGCPIKRKHHYFCSEFVADTLIRSEAIQINRDPALVRPNDFLQMVGLRPVYFGTIESLDRFIACEAGTVGPVGVKEEKSIGKNYSRQPLNAESLYSLLSHFRRV